MMGKCISTELFLTLSLTIAFSHSAKVEFYEMQNYEGPKHDTTSSAACVNLPSYFTNVNGSIRTDGCIMVFDTKDCKESSLKTRSETPYLYTHNGYPFTFYVRSFRDCNGLESDQKINVDIYNKLGYKKDKIQIRDMCTCQNLPRSTRGKELSANNHGNCFTVYMESDCEGNSTKIPGGQNATSLHFRKHFGCPYIYPKENECSSRVRITEYKSISPCSYLPQHCLGLNAVIYSIEPLDDFTLDPNSVKAFAMTGSGIFRNTGPNTMTERYSAELEVAETQQIEISESLRTLNSFTLEAGYKMTTKGGVPGVAEVEVEKHIKVALSHERENSRTDTETSSTQKTNKEDSPAEV